MEYGKKIENHGKWGSGNPLRYAAAPSPGGYAPRWNRAEYQTPYPSYSRTSCGIRDSDNPTTDGKHRHTVFSRTARCFGRTHPLTSRSAWSR